MTNTNSSIHYIEHKNINFQKWDSCIEHSPHGNFSAFSFYLNEVAPGWDALIMGDYEAIMPLTQRKKFGINYLFPPFFVNQLGVFSKDNSDEHLIDRFLHHIPKKFRFIQISVNLWNRPLADSFIKIQKKCQFLELNQSYTEIKKHYSENTVRNIHKALKANLNLVESIPARSVTTLFKEGRGKQLGHFSVTDYLMMERLFNQLIEKKFGFTLAVNNEEGTILSAAIFTISHRRITYLKGGSSEAGKKVGAMHFLFDELYKKYSNSDFRFDFGGSSVPSVERFNKSFGATDYFYDELKRNTLPFPISLLKK